MANGKSGKGLRGLLVLTALVIGLLTAWGALVRSTGSGLGCPDWPLCHGRLFPPMEDLAAWLEWIHRLLAASATPLLFLSALLAWRRERQPALYRPLFWALGLVFGQALLGGLTVILELPPTIVAVHLAMALSILALTLVAATRAFAPWAARPPHRDLAAIQPAAAAVRAIGMVGLALFALTLVGATVTGSGASWACSSWPFCEGWTIWPGDLLGRVHMLHRLVALGVGVALIWLAVRLAAWPGIPRGIFRWMIAACVLYLIQIGLGAINLWMGFPALLNTLHLGLATAIWAAVVIAWVWALGEAQWAEPALQEAVRLRHLWEPYFTLTKPGIVALLLVTTAGAMLIAQSGLPPILTFIYTLLGGFLVSGGANAMNNVWDADLDQRMHRTARRPIPAGRIGRREAAVVALLFSALGLLLLWTFVNATAAGLALAGWIWYVGIYTMILKRWSPQNIVIGGAAGGFAPLVGWAAITGRVDPMALFLFALIFFWTPPHTWAFAILTERDYREAGIPMLPVVTGARPAALQALIYTGILAALGLAPFLMGAMGRLYLAGSLLLNAWLLGLALRLWRDPSKAHARRLYHASNAYLFMFFVMMAVDRLVRL
ncbi:MAG: heme o synthase [Thermoflexus hugenholtzii]|jgi:protoheme IX farnesyltransferase|uniref:heme o synthase n=1 Tax=Thermoflexus TaxID=1495649 RepID=UPI001C76433F|nr:MULTISPECIES: heme o synthase [Thermoflexus]QWK10523.1 MAG: heme o synthase [Thermoflexus hugenholtzii]